MWRVYRVGNPVEGAGEQEAEGRVETAARDRAREGKARHVCVWDGTGCAPDAEDGEGRKAAA